MRLHPGFLRGGTSTLQVIEQRALHALNAACEDHEDSGVVVEMRRDSTESDRARKSAKAFRSMIEVEEGVVYEDALDPWQREALDVIYPAFEYAVGATNKKPEFQCGYRELPRGHSKTTDNAIAVIFALLKAPRLVRGYVVAADEDQGKLTTEAAEKVVALNPWLSEEIEVSSKRIRNKITGAECQVLAANAGGAYGKEPAFIIIDELTVWTKPAVFDAMFSALPKRPRCAMIVTTNAGYGKGVSWQWKRREKCRESHRWYFQTMDGPQASWQSPESIEQQREELDPLEFERLWMNRWLSGISGGIPYAHIIRATRLAGSRLNSSHGADFVLGSGDLGLTGHRASLVWGACYAATRTVKILMHRTWYPKEFPEQEVDLGLVARTIKNDVIALGGADHVYLDQWQAAQMRQGMGETPCSLVHYNSKSMAAMATATLEAFTNGTVELYADERLESDLQLLRIVTGENSQLRKIVAEEDEHGHADSAMALVQLLWKASLWFAEWVPGIGFGDEETEEESVFI